MCREVSEQSFRTVLEDHNYDETWTIVVTTTRCIHHKP